MHDLDAVLGFGHQNVGFGGVLTLLMRRHGSSSIGTIGRSEMIENDVRHVGEYLSGTRGAARSTSSSSSSSSAPDRRSLSLKVLRTHLCVGTPTPRVRKLVEHVVLVHAPIDLSNVSLGLKYVQLVCVLRNHVLSEKEASGKVRMRGSSTEIASRRRRAHLRVLAVSLTDSRRGLKISWLVLPTRSAGQSIERVVRVMIDAGIVFLIVLRDVVGGLIIALVIVVCADDQ